MERESEKRDLEKPGVNSTQWEKMAGEINL